MGVDRRGLQLLVPQKDLDHPDVDVLLEKVGGEAVAQGDARFEARAFHLGGGGGQNETAIGFGALQGNSSNVVFGGTPTLNDTETLTFVSTNPALSGTSPIAITITISSGETTTQRAAAMAAASVTRINSRAILRSGRGDSISSVYP